jgi:hypothetical protein
MRYPPPTMRAVWRSVVAACVAVTAGAGCGGEAPEAAPPLGTMRLLDPELTLTRLQGALHLRVFPKGALRCDPVSGQIRTEADASALEEIPGGVVEPALRCGAQWAANAARFGTASPVDACFDRTTGTTASIAAAGTYLVLVHGQGDIRLPDNTMRSGILGAGCAEVTVAPGQQQSITITLREQRPAGVCGDGTLDFDESCDLGMANGGAECSAQCQTVPLQASTRTDGEVRSVAVVWGSMQRLVAAWHVENTSTEDVRARFLTREGAPETSFGALLNDVNLGAAAGLQSNVRLAPYAGAVGRGFLGAWETDMPQNVGLQAFDDDAPTTTFVRVPAAPSGGRNNGPAVAASGDRAMTVWRALDSGGRPLGVRAASTPLARRLAAPTMTRTVADGDVSSVAVAARPDGRFVAVWSAGGDIFARVLDGEGVPQGMAAVRVNANAAEVQDQPAVAALGSGEVVVAWRDAARDASDNDGTSIRWTRLDAGLGRVGNVGVANSTTAGSQSTPAVVVSGGASPAVLIAWRDEATGLVRARLRTPEDGDVFARIGRGAGDFAVSDGRASGAPAVTAGGADNARFAVAWVREGGPVMLRQFPR